VFRFNVPLLPITTDDVSARRSAALRVMVPAVTVVVPVNVFAPDNVRVPVPCFVKLPPVPEMTPAKVVEALPAVVSVLVNEPEPSVMLAAVSLDVEVATDATVSL